MMIAPRLRCGPSPWWEEPTPSLNIVVGHSDTGSRSESGIRTLRLGNETADEEFNRAGASDVPRVRPSSGAQHRPGGRRRSPRAHRRGAASASAGSVSEPTAPTRGRPTRYRLLAVGL